jgi:hypothetical protein
VTGAAWAEAAEVCAFAECLCDLADLCAATGETLADDAGVDGACAANNAGARTTSGMSTRKLRTLVEIIE